MRHRSRLRYRSRGFTGRSRTRCYGFMEEIPVWWPRHPALLGPYLYTYGFGCHSRVCTVGRRRYTLFNARKSSAAFNRSIRGYPL